MTASFPVVSASDVAQRMTELRPLLEAVDLDNPPDNVVRGSSIARSNGDGIEPNEDVTRLLVLAEQGTVSRQEVPGLVKHIVLTRSR